MQPTTGQIPSSLGVGARESVGSCSTGEGVGLLEGTTKVGGSTAAAVGVGDALGNIDTVDETLGIPDGIIDTVGTSEGSLEGKFDGAAVGAAFPREDKKESMDCRVSEAKGTLSLTRWLSFACALLTKGN